MLVVTMKFLLKTYIMLFKIISKLKKNLKMKKKEKEKKKVKWTD